MRSIHTRLLSFIRIVAAVFLRDRLFHNVLPFTMTVLHVYVRRANFTTKLRFEVEKLPSCA